MRMAKTDRQLRQCPKCGALYDREEARCPYCGFIHEAGAEKKFLRKLESTRRELDLVDDQAREDYKEELRRSSRRTGKRVLLIAGILALLAGAFFLWERSLFRDDRDYAQEMVWQHEHFPELDRLYEEGRYEELDERLYTYGRENHDLWEWQYYEEFYDYKDQIREKEKQP